MSLFAKKKGRHSTVALVDIGMDRVSVGLAALPEGSQPTLVATVRLPVVPTMHDDNLDEAMLAALKEAAERLMREGLGALAQVSGSKHIDRVLITISCPWQRSEVRVERIRPGEPFTYTKSMMSEVLAVPRDEEEGFGSPEQRVIATLLNGYSVEEPFGKHVRRAELVILASRLKLNMVSRIEEIVRHAFSARTVATTSFASTCYQVLHALYPHEKDFLVLSVSGDCTEAVNVKRGHMVDAGALSCGTNALLEAAGQASRRVHTKEFGVTTHERAVPGYINATQNERFAEEAEKAETAWLASLASLLQEFAARNALPHMIFLLAEDATRGFLTQALGAPELRSLWLAKDPVPVVPILPRQFAQLIRRGPMADQDIELSLLALYASKHT